jgi:uncharacterized RDD family membrane protein YckC
MELNTLGISAGLERHSTVDAAPLGRRAAARLIDGLIAWVLADLVLIAVHPTVPFLPWLIGSATGWLYMVLSQVLTRNTIGKYLMGIQVVSAVTQFPSLGKLAIREVIGPMGIFGYWAAREDPNRQTWADAFAETYVVNRPRSGASKVIVGLAAIALCAPASLPIWRAIQKDRKAAALRSQITSVAMDVDKMAPEIQKLGPLFQSHADKSSVIDKIQQALPLLDRYDAAVRKLEELGKTALAQGLVKPDKVANMQALLATIPNRLRATQMIRAGLHVLDKLSSLPAPTGRNVGNWRDASWRIMSDTTQQIGGPGPAFVVRLPGSEWTRIPGAVWIGPSANQSKSLREKCCKNTSDTYQTKFTLDKDTVSTAGFDLMVAADDYVDVLLNGKPVQTHVSQKMWATPARIQVRSGFQAGENVLTFVVTNVGGATGLAVAVSPTANPAK